MQTEDFESNTGTGFLGQCKQVFLVKWRIRIFKRNVIYHGKSPSSEQI